MRQNKRGILMFASMVLSISLMCGAQVVKATDEVIDGSLNETGGILLKDTNANGQIDEVHITINYADATTETTDLDTNEITTATIEKFVVTSTGTPVTIGSIKFVSSGDAIVIFRLVLDESDVNLSIDTSETALNVVYTPTDTATDLEITDGTTPVSVEAIESDVVEKDGAQPIILTVVDQEGTSLDDGTDIPADANIIVTFSEPMDTETLDANDEWSISPDQGSWSDPAWSDDKILTLAQTVNFNLGNTETVILTAPLAISGATAEDKKLQDNSFTFTITEEITPPDGADVGNPTTPNPNSRVTLYRMSGQHRVYVIKNKKKHWIKTPKEFEDANYSWGEIQEITAELLEQYPDAEPLISELLRVIGDHKVYKLEAGKKSWIKTLGEFNAAGHKWEDVQEVSAEVLASYQNAIVSDLLRAIGDHKVYKIKNGKKLWVETLREFNDAGHKWENVQEVSAQDLDDYPDSDSEDV